MSDLIAIAVGIHCALNAENVIRHPDIIFLILIRVTLIVEDQAVRDICPPKRNTNRGY